MRLASSPSNRVATPLRNLALSLLHAGGAFELARLMARHRLLVLTYHHVLPRPAQPDRARVSNIVYVDEFDREVAYLARHCHLVSGDELRAHIHGRPLPPHSVLLTFDDGYSNNYRYAFPVLRQHGAPAVFFLTSEFIGDRDGRLWFDRLDAAISSAPDLVTDWLRAHTSFHDMTLDRFRDVLKRLPADARDALVRGAEQAVDGVEPPAVSKERVEPMSWEEVREMADAGMTMGAHTATHQILAGSPAAEVMTELATSRGAIEARTGRDCWCFSYPNGEAGDFRDADVRLLKACGFECAFTQVPGFVDPQANRYALPRLGIPSTENFRVFLARASGLLPLLTQSTTGIMRWARAS